MEVIKEKHDYKNRKRYLTMVYSVSKDEQREIYARINLTGRKIQDYMYQSTVHGSIVIAGNETLRRTVMNRLDDIKQQLQTYLDGEEVDPIVIKELRMIYELTETWI